jgi:ABC-type uncharacterized transport system fused permease/ATPase subunit
MSLDKKHLRKLLQSNTASPTLIKTAICLAGGYAAYKTYNAYRSKLYPQQKKSNSNDHPDDGKISKKMRKKMTKTDMEKLLKIFRILIPSVWTKQFGLVCVHSIALISRALLSICVANLDGRITKSIVEKDLLKFLVYLARWIGLAVPATFVNSLLRYLEGKISLSFRTVLVNHAYKLYFDKQTYYKVGNLDSRLNAVDESLVEDLNLFCNSVAHLYSHLTKPVLDVILLTSALVALARKRGETGLGSGVVAAAVLGMSGQILKMCSPKFGELVSEESARRGVLRTIHSRIINNAEEIAFYGGHKREHAVLMNAYNSFAEQINVTLKQVG